MAACDLWVGGITETPREDSLSVVERERAGRFRHEIDRRRYISSRMSLRQVLGARTGIAPREVVIALRCVSCGSREHGKPYLPEFPEMTFNLSHSGDLVAIAMARCVDIGVDLERIPPTASPGLWDGMASRGDRTRCPEAPPWEEQIAVWVRKEAVVKATGEGLSTDLRVVDVDFSGKSRTGERLPREVWVEDVVVDAGYRCSVATVGSRPEVTRIP